MNFKQWELYDLLLDHALKDNASNDVISQIMIGQVWTLVQLEDEHRIGLAMSPSIHTRTLNWPGTLSGKQAREIAGWVKHWDHHESVVGMAVINALINVQVNAQKNQTGTSMTNQNVRTTGVPANLGVFEYFLPRMKGKNVAVIGRYPDLERYESQLNMAVLERLPQAGDLPDPACEYILPESDWVFITASSIPNKTFPRLLALSQDATVVLMGPGTPWIDELDHFGVDYLAGVVVTDVEKLIQTVMEGGGRRIFETGVSYQIKQIN